MKSAEQRIENQVQFWSMLGPFILLVSITILLYKLSSHWYFPICALVGIPLCVKWKMKGMALALSFLFLLGLISYQSLDLDQRYWHVGMGLAMAFSFIILTLSLEEAESIVTKLQRESQSRLDNFLRLDETTKKAETNWLEEKNQLVDRLEAFTKDISKVQVDKQIFYKLAQLAKDELIQIRDQHHLLQQELFYKKQQIAQLNEKLEESELTVQNFVNSDSEQKIIDLSEKLRDEMGQHEVLQNKIAHLQALLESQKKEQLQLLDQLNLFKEQEEEKNCLEIRTEALQNQLDILDKEKEQLQGTFTALRIQYEKVLHSENHHKQYLQTTSSRLAQLESISQNRERDYAQLQETKCKLEAQLSQGEKEFNNRLDQLQHHLKQLERELALKENETVNLKSELKKLATDLEKKDGLISLTTSQNQELREIQCSLENQLDEKALKLRHAEIAVHRLVDERENAPKVDPNAHRIESLYKQLRAQFQEKTKVLDQTRQELFVVQEKLLQVLKEREEERVFDVSEYESLLQREYVKLIRTHENSEKIAAAEITALEDLVSVLISKGK